jgi:hypothetical protein
MDMAGPVPVAPTKAELTNALRYMTLDRLEPLMRSYLDFVRASDQPQIDASAILARLPKGQYFLEVRENVPDCELISETGRLFRLQQLLGVFFLLALIGGPLATSYFPSIMDFFLIAALCWGGMLAVMLAGCIVIDFIRRKQDRIVCSIPTELHQTLLNVRCEVREKRKSWAGVTIVANLVGKGILGPIGHGLGGEQMGEFVAQLMEFASEKAGERVIEKRSEQLREEILARFAPPVIHAGMSASDSLEQYAKFVSLRSGLEGPESRLPPSVALEAVRIRSAMQQTPNKRLGGVEEKTRRGD